jgi:preprotein translocase subunit SecG
MVYELLVSLFVFVCIFLMLIILIQKSKGSIGMGGLGGGSQMLFGGSGGQDMFQKLTWALGAVFMFGSLLLALMRASETSRYLNTSAVTQQVAQAASEMPEVAPQATAPIETPEVPAQESTEPAAQ